MLKLRLSSRTMKPRIRGENVGNIESKFYPGARHELLVETNKAEVFADIAGWLEKQLHL